MNIPDYGQAAYLRYRGFTFSYQDKQFLFYDAPGLEEAAEEWFLSEAKAVNDILRSIILPLTRQK